MYTKTETLYLILYFPYTNNGQIRNKNAKYIMFRGSRDSIKYKKRLKREVKVRNKQNDKTIFCKIKEREKVDF